MPDSSAFIDTVRSFLPDTDSDRLALLEQQWAGAEAPAFTSVELEAAGKQAWKNSERCIGRLAWDTLKIFDARKARSSREIFEACLHHLVYSTNEGRIIPMMTVLPSDREMPGLKIRSEQLIRYAGYRMDDGSLLGDPAQEEMTQFCVAQGWQPPETRTAFDPLPLVIEHPNEGVQWYQIPKQAILEVPIEHPRFGWFESLELKWHALPAVSNLYLQFCDLKYPAPFSGYYMGTEIGSRNFGDIDRYDLLPVVAKKMGLDTSREGSLWKDRALIELNSAVLHSYRQMGIMIVDHHTASAQFQQFCRKEEALGHEVAGDWSWLVPPISGSACPVFHRYYSDQLAEPRFGS